MSGRPPGNRVGGVARDSPEAVDLVVRAEELRGAGVVGVAITFVDDSGITRVKAVPIGRLVAAAREGLGASPSFDSFLFDSSIAMGSPLATPDGDLRLIPDPTRPASSRCTPLPAGRGRPPIGSVSTASRTRSTSAASRGT